MNDLLRTKPEPGDHARLTLGSDMNMTVDVDSQFAPEREMVTVRGDRRAFVFRKPIASVGFELFLATPWPSPMIRIQWGLISVGPFLFWWRRF